MAPISKAGMPVMPEAVVIGMASDPNATGAVLSYRTAVAARMGETPRR